MELLNLAKKTDLLNIANHYALTSVKPSLLKHEIKNILIKVLVDQEIFDPSTVSFVLLLKLTCSCGSLKSSDRFSWKNRIRAGRKKMNRAVGTGRKK